MAQELCKSCLRLFKSKPSWCIEMHKPLAFPVYFDLSHLHRVDPSSPIEAVITLPWRRGKNFPVLAQQQPNPCIGYRANKPDSSSASEDCAACLLGTTPHQVLICHFIFFSNNVDCSACNVFTICCCSLT